MNEQSVDLSNAVDTLKEMLSGEDGQRQIQNILNMFTENPPEQTSPGNVTGGIDPNNIEMVMKIQKIMSQLNNKNNSTQSQLLMALKPFLKPSRREKLDNAMRLLNLGNVIDAMRETQGD